jgi:hypothetical protein
MTFWLSLFMMAASNVNHIEGISRFTYFNYNHLGETMPMLPYPPYTKPSASENSLLRVLGGVLALLSILLTLLGFILHQRVADLVLAIIVGMFALRVFLLWLGDKPQHQQFTPGWSSSGWVRYPMQSPPHTASQPVSHASPYFPSQPLYQLAPEQHSQQAVPMSPTPTATPPAKMPHSIRLKRSPKVSAFPAQLPRLSQHENWQYDDGTNFTQQQRGNDHGTA